MGLPRATRILRESGSQGLDQAAPRIGGLVMHPQDIDGVEMNLAVSRSDAQEGPFMGPVIRLVGRQLLAIRKLPMNLRVKVRERSAQMS